MFVCMGERENELLSEGGGIAREGSICHES